MLSFESVIPPYKTSVWLETAATKGRLCVCVCVRERERESVCVCESVMQVSIDVSFICERQGIYIMDPLQTRSCGGIGG